MKYIFNWWNEFFKNFRMIFKIQSQSSEVQCGCFNILKYMTDFFSFFMYCVHLCVLSAMMLKQLSLTYQNTGEN